MVEVLSGGSGSGSGKKVSTAVKLLALNCIGGIGCNMDTANMVSVYMCVCVLCVLCV